LVESATRITQHCFVLATGEVHGVRAPRLGPWDDFLQARRTKAEKLAAAIEAVPKFVTGDEDVDDGGQGGGYEDEDEDETPLEDADDVGAVDDTS
jgi:hypothetical protein